MSGTEEQKEADFSDTPEGWANRWKHELTAAREKLKDWHTQGSRVVRRYRDDRDAKDENDIRWNLFTSSTETKMATLYGQTPKVSAERRYADAHDDVARVASEALERILNADFEKDSDTAEDAFRYALEDRLLPGAGLVRVRYETGKTEQEAETPAQVDEKTGRELAPAVPGKLKKPYECVHVDYVHWRDMLWGPARVWHEVPWLAYLNEMSASQVDARFGEGTAAQLPMQGGMKGKDGDEKKPTPWQRAHVWEIWDKATKRVFWYVEGFGKTLDAKEDPYGLDGFFPSPKPLLSLVTTTGLVPKPEYQVAQDLYREVDSLSARIDALTDALRVRGAYDASNGSLGEILSKPDNTLVPVQNWAAFGEKGGLAAAVQFLPLEQVAATIQILSERRAVAKDALFEVTGMADVMRGQGSTPGTTATEQSVKAKFGSVRLQRMQDEFARFVTATVRLKAQLVARFYDEATILQQSNLAMTEDGAVYGAQAVALIKSGQSQFRIDVKPEAVALQDFAQLKSDAMELMSGLTNFMQAAAPIAQAMPGSLPFLLELLGASVARVRGASSLEGIIDGAITAAKSAAQQPQAAQQGPTPEQMKVQAVQMKVQGDLAKEDKKLNNDLVRYQAETQMKGVQEATQREQNVLEARQKAAITAATRPVPGGMP